MRKFQLTQCEINNLEINGDDAIIDVIKSLEHNIQQPYIVYLLDAKKNIEDSINDRLQNSKSNSKGPAYPHISDSQKRMENSMDN